MKIRLMELIRLSAGLLMTMGLSVGTARAYPVVPSFQCDSGYGANCYIASIGVGYYIQSGAHCYCTEFDQGNPRFLHVISSVTVNESCFVDIAAEVFAYFRGDSDGITAQATADYGPDFDVQVNFYETQKCSTGVREDIGGGSYPC